MVKVLVCDDHEIVRDGIRLIASETNDIKISEEASTASEGLEKALKNDYDVILLDISLPDRSGLDILKELLALKPTSKVLILSMHPEDQYAVRVLKAGAMGYLTKSSASNELPAAIRKVASGRRYITSTIAERLSGLVERGSDRESPDCLSDREYQVLCLLARGRSAKEIARMLVLSPNSIKTYRTRLMKKMGFPNNAELVRYAIERRVVT